MRPTDDVADAISELTRADRMWSRSQCLARPSPVPASAGLYAWFFREIPAAIDGRSCVQLDGCTLLYVGIAPTRALGRDGLPSKNTLRSRIRMHYAGNAESSTLRLTLGALLSERLKLKRQPAARGKSFGEGERKLSAWMEQNALVVWTVRPKPWLIEPSVIERLYLPFNLAHNRSHPFHDQLMAARGRLGL